MLSSADIAPADLLSMYNTRQGIEQIFDLAGNGAGPEPAMVHDELHLKGHLLLSFIGAVVRRLLERRAREARANLQDMLASLRFQNCKLFGDGMVVVREARQWGSACYKMLGLKCPLSLGPLEQRSRNLSRRA